MAGLYNRVKMTTATTGTGTVTLGSAASNAYFTFAEAGVPNAKQVRYVIEEGTDFEIGLGTYTSAGTTLSRDSVTASKIGGTAGLTKMTLAGSATVRIDAAAEDFNNGGLTTGQIPGTTTNDAATAGNIGEFVSSTVVAGSAISLTTGVAANVTSISLTAGDWDVRISAYFQPTSTTTIQDFIASISTTSATLDSTPGRDGKVSLNSASTGANVTYCIHAGSTRISLSSTTTVYFVAYSDFGTSTCKAYGIIGARRMR